jgi:hypothetical protein
MFAQAEACGYKKRRVHPARVDFFLDIVARPFYHSVVDLFSDSTELDLVPRRRRDQKGRR